MLDADGERRRHLSQALRGVRRLRGLRAAEVAAALGMPLRSYEAFEAGQGRITFERLERFAAATDSDAFAIAAAAALGTPEFALRCADNKLMHILMMALRDFDADLGDDIPDIEVRTLISAFNKLFGDLAALVRKRDAFSKAWLGERSIPSGPRRSLAALARRKRD